MVNRSLLVLVAVTLAIITLAWNITANRAPSTLIAKEVLYPNLVNAVNTVVQIEVHDNEQLTEIKLDDQQWKLTSAAGYAAEASKVKALVLSIAELEVLETKTSLAERYPRLGVEDVDQNGAESRRVALKNASGETLVDLIVGKRKASPSASRSAVSALYVRKIGTPESLLVEGNVVADADPSGWWDDNLLDVESDRIRQIRIERPDSDPIVLAREAFDADFALIHIPVGKKLKSAAVLGSMANALSNLSFDNVSNSATVTVPAKTTTTTYSAFDGLVITATLVEADGLIHTLFDARYDPSLVVTPVPDASSGSEEPRQTSAIGVPETGESSDNSATVAELAAQAINEEAAMLTERLQPWAFILPEYKLSLITKTIDDLVNDIPPKESTKP